MKKIILLGLTVTLLFSCDKEKPKDYAVLSGEVENFRSRSMTLTGYNFEKRIRFDRKTKTFTDTLKNITPGHYTLKIGKRPVDVYLSSVEDLKIIVDAKKRTEDPTFEGPNASINNYLAERKKKFGAILGNPNKLFALNEDEFLSKMDEYKSELEDLADASQLPADYLALEKRNINYELAIGLYNYEKFHRILYGDDEFKVSDSFPIDIPTSVALSNADDYIFSKHYRDLVKRRLDDITNKKSREDSDFNLSYLETVQTEVTDPLIKNDLIHKAALVSITYTSELKEYYDKYMAYSTNEDNKKEITEMYNKLKLTAKGQPSPKFKNFDNYNGGKTSLDDLTGKGKYIYIDVWATWCSFCKKEIPLLKRMEQQYHGKNIEFVSINVDTRDKKKKWEETIEEKEMTGVQLFSGKSHLDLDFAQDYLIKGLPRFILIDPDGKIVTANAPRPSEGDKLEEIFEELGI
ncbi:TlpA disulfide reductase family protein [Tenacibaculum sp. IB213877]|uniref:TlpA family protein disulfide reductase n=1 Tax=Tenacibaculum sp. IB213877 TaxID=3097351 RepID=UPI002A598900|nr:TlpA disulfide reductase family protein [Tenacibaculum sp. IB213877]MDY0779945.1 TlpA disulfide reductase family protein [Tenacibaculum sp. IB213877]